MEEIKKQLILFGWMLNSYVFISEGELVGKCEISQGSDMQNPKYTKLKEFVAESEKDAFLEAVSFILKNYISYAGNSRELYRLFKSYEENTW